jgi:hypothetical protein
VGRGVLWSHIEDHVAGLGGIDSQIQRRAQESGNTCLAHACIPYLYPATG